MMRVVDPWTEFGPYALKIAGHCKIVPGMQVRGRLHSGELTTGRVNYYPSTAGVIDIREHGKSYVLTATSPAPDLSDPITLAYCWPVLRAHLTADELITLRILAAAWSMEPPGDAADDSPANDNDHD
jgi:hypothetical protein